jgi:tetratricopeptide (TPR) repeat protein
MRRVIVVALTALIMVLASDRGSAQTTTDSALPADLGVIDFPTSGPADAQAHFLRGAAMLHSFGLEDAALEFRQAQTLAPDFAMAYWGEAMSYNHPLQRFQEWDLPRQALERLGPDREARVAKAATDREKGFVRAVDALFFGPGEETDRRVAYATEMERLAEAYPDDHEVQAFCALALLAASSDYGYEQYRTNIKAGALALRVFNENANHPGAAHYIIHAFDDPIHAAIALPAAKRFAAIASGVVHALHMPSHIFIQLGMWDDVSASNDASYAAALEMFEQPEAYASDTQRYFNARNLTHALDWGQYGDLQRGDYAKAWKGVENGDMVIANTEAELALERAAITRPRYVVETEQWQTIDVSPHAAEGGHLANGMSAVRTGDLDAAEAAATALADLDGAVAAIAHHEVRALVHAARGEADAATAAMDKAIELAETRGAPRGAPTPLKPAHELYGEILLDLNRPAEAAEQFKRSLLRMPNRSLSLRGLARAAAGAGDPSTSRAQYAQLVAQWRGADDASIVKEARQHLDAGQ